MINTVSKETQNQAMKTAKASQRQNQTKEQTKLIAKGIEKGIAEYKKQQNKKSRERDKIRKTKLKTTPDITHSIEVVKLKNNKLPWVLLALSWLGFIFWVITSYSAKVFFVTHLLSSFALLP